MSIVTLTINPAIDIFADAPRVIPTRKIRCSSVRRDPGGGGVNVARVISRLGGSVRAFYPTGGPIGALLRRLVEAEGIESVTVALAQDTRESFTVDDQEQGEQYRFVLPGPKLSRAECETVLAAAVELAREARYVIASGSLPEGAPDDFLASVARVAKDLGARVVIDSSGKSLAAALEEGVFLIKPSLRELEELTGSRLAERADRVAAARAIIARGGAEIVALTLGHRGALLVTESRALLAPALPVKPVSAVGAGDSFLGAMLWSLARGDAIEEAFRYGVAGGSAAVMTPGTDLCRAEDVHALYRDVALEEV